MKGKIIQEHMYVSWAPVISLKIIKFNCNLTRTISLTLSNIVYWGHPLKFRTYEHKICYKRENQGMLFLITLTKIYQTYSANSTLRF